MTSEKTIPVLASVGVIIPTRNRRTTLLRSIESVQNQTWRDLQILVVDDASTDGTADWIDSLHHPRLHCLRLPVPGGAGAARTAGVHALHTEWIAFQDSDDRWHPDKLEKQMSALSAASVGATSSSVPGASYCRCLRISSSGEAQPFPPLHLPLPCMGGELFERLLGGNLISTQTALVRRSLLTACGDFDDRFAPLEDWECFIRLSRLTTWAFLPEALVDAPYSSDSISLNNERWIAALTLLFKEYSAEFTARPRLLSRHWSTLAHRHYLAGRPAIARRLYLQAFRKNPSRVTSAIAAFLTTLPPLYRALTSSAH